MPGRVNTQSEAYVRRASEAKRAMARVTRNLNTVLQQMAALTEDELEALANSILERSLYLTPIDTGELRNSAGIAFQQKTSRVVATGGIGNSPIRIVIFYGKDQRAPYAVFVHEILEFYHAPPTQAKFLQTAVMEAAAITPRSIARRIIRELSLG